MGFVGAAESKAELHRDPRGIPYATLLGRRGGSAMAAAVVNALTRGAAGVNLEMYAANEAAGHAYRAVGFVEQGRYMSALIDGGESSPDAEE